MITIRPITFIDYSVDLLMLLSLGLFIILMGMSPLTLEKSRGRLLHTDSVLGARTAPAHPLCDPQHGAATPFLQPSQSGVQQ